MIKSLVTEWCDAREAILLVNWGDPVTAKANTHLWTRLGHAEAALMAHARELPKTPVDASPETPDSRLISQDVSPKS